MPKKVAFKSSIDEIARSVTWTDRENEDITLTLHWADVGENLHEWLGLMGLQLLTERATSGEGKDSPEDKLAARRENFDATLAQGFKVRQDTKRGGGGIIKAEVEAIMRVRKASAKDAKIAWAELDTEQQKAFVELEAVKAALADIRAERATEEGTLDLAAMLKG